MGPNLRYPTVPLVSGYAMAALMCTLVQVLALFELSKIVTACFGACLVVLIDEIDGICNESPEPSSSRLVYQFQTSFSR